MGIASSRIRPRDRVPRPVLHRSETDLVNLAVLNRSEFAPQWVRGHLFLPEAAAGIRGKRWSEQRLRQGQR